MPFVQNFPIMLTDVTSPWTRSVECRFGKSRHDPNPPRSASDTCISRITELLEYLCFTLSILPWLRFFSLSPKQSYVPTVFENYTASFEIDSLRVELSLWDTSGKMTSLQSTSSRSRGALFAKAGFPKICRKQCDITST